MADVRQAPRGRARLTAGEGGPEGPTLASPEVIDLHTHSTVSDGSDPPERIPELAAAGRLLAPWP